MRFIVRHNISTLISWCKLRLDIDAFSLWVCISRSLPKNWIVSYLSLIYIRWAQTSLHILVFIISILIIILNILIKTNCIALILYFDVMSRIILTEYIIFTKVVFIFLFLEFIKFNSWYNLYIFIIPRFKKFFFYLKCTILILLIIINLLNCFCLSTFIF